MTTEVQAAQAVVEATVAAEGAKGEAVAATDAAIQAEGAAAGAVAAAATVEAMAERAVDVATLDAEQRIARFQEEMATCRQEIETLKGQLTETTALNLSISEKLTRLAWLEEAMAETTAAESGGPLGTSSATDGGTSAPDGGKKTGSESGEPAKEKDPEKVASESPSSSEKPNGEKPAQGKAARHRWL